MAWSENKKLRKFTEGPVMRDVPALIDALMVGEYIMWRGKPMHTRVLSNWSFAMLMANLHCGMFRYAQINPIWQKIQDDNAAIADMEFEEVTPL